MSATVARLIPFVLASALATVQEFTAEDLRRMATYGAAWGLADTSVALPPESARRLEADIERARRDFGGRGPALAQYFVQHVDRSVDNAAFFFLFRAIGDLRTARVLLQALPYPPVPAGAALGRDVGEIAISLQAILKNDEVAADPATAGELDGTRARARQQPGGSYVAETIVSLLGKCKTPEATRVLQRLAADPEPAVRLAAVSALGGAASPDAAETLRRTLREDASPEARARAAAALAQAATSDARDALTEALARERDPSVVDAIVRALTSMHALPSDPNVCLDLAGRCWDVYVARPLFECWLASVTREAVIDQATSAGWTVRALALSSLAGDAEAQRAEILPMFRLPQPPIAPPLPGASNRRPTVARPGEVAPRARATPAFDEALRDRLLQSAVEVLSHNSSGTPVPNAIASSTVQMTLAALWEISGRDMPVALRFADRIVPIRGRYAGVGRFGASYYLAGRDPAAYVRVRRPRQLMTAGVLAVLVSLLALAAPLRKTAIAFIAAIAMWAGWTLFQTSVRELPPFPLSFLTAPFLGFICAGATAGLLSRFVKLRWLRLLGAPIAAGVAALIVCGYSRSASLFPIGGEGWELIFDPLISAIIAAPAAIVLAGALELLPAIAQAPRRG